jgi:4-hydroxybenzoate polyprenyltransferase
METALIDKSGESLQAKKPSTFGAVVKSLRPQQWSKNLLLFVGLIFSRSLFDPHNILYSFAGFAIFCAASSAIYILNDLCDFAADQQHEIKRLRPIASGALKKNLARIILAALFLFAVIGAIIVNFNFALILGIYLVLSISYSLGLKRIVILDVMIIASGFVLRAVAGAAVIGVEVSHWLVLCTSMLALLVGFGKRRHELNLLGDGAANHRANLDEYSTMFLDSMITVCGGAAIVAYALYTMADETIARFGTRGLLFTLPFVVYGIFRYLFLIHKKQEGGDPSQLLFRDLPSFLNLLFWAATAAFVIYGQKFIR